MTLDDLFVALKSGRVALTDNLPIFADPDWSNPIGVWSWDATRAIQGTCVDNLEIVPRAGAES